MPASASVAHGQKRRQMRPRHGHSEPDSEPPGLIFSSSAAQEVNLSIGAVSLKEKSHESATDRRKIGVLGVPPNAPRRARAPASSGPVIDLKSLWRSLRSFPHRRWGPQEHKPRDLARAAAPRSRSSQRFPQSWGRIVRPEPRGLSPRGICNPRSRHRTRPEGAWDGPGPPDSAPDP